MDAWKEHKHAPLMCFTLAFAMMLSSVGGQLLCGDSPHSSALTVNTHTGSVLLECDVPEHLVLQSFYSWLWAKLAPDNTVELQLPLTGPQADRTANYSSYDLSVLCNSSGIYEARYLNTTPTLGEICIHSCVYYLIEVTEVRASVLLEKFALYPNQTGLPIPGFRGNSTMTIARPENSSRVSVGSCSSDFYLETGCVADVRGEWYKDGIPLNPRSSPQRYLVTSSGELLILTFTPEDIGYYICVTTLQDGLGSYLTVDVEVTLQEPEVTSPPTSEPTEVTTDREPLLEPWEVGLIAANASVVVLFVMVVGVVCLWRGAVRRRRRRHERGGAVKYGARGVEFKFNALEETDGDAFDFTGPAEIPFSSILFEELLHKGTFKVVHHATVTHPAYGMMTVPVAVKRLRDLKSELGREELMAEAYVLRAIHDKAGPHPNIVSLLGVTTPQGGATCLLLEFVPHGSLDNFLQALKDGPVPEWYVQFVRETQRDTYHKHISGDFMSILVQVAEGMKFLTDRGFIHRDLSTRNILIGDRLNIKIANPGMHYEGYYYVVTEREHKLQDMAPECLWEKRYSVWSDVWSFGILTYRVATLGSTPFPNVQVDEFYNKMVAGVRPEQLASFSNELYFLLRQCWQFISVERPTFTSILSDLQDMAEKPTKHIILKVSKSENARGYISETGQVYLHHVASVSKPHSKYHPRQSGNQTSIYSSMDDTMFTRETAETTVFAPSEIDVYDSYEDYLKGDFEGLEKATQEWVDSEGANVPKKIAYFSGTNLPNGIQIKAAQEDDDKEVEQIGATANEQVENDTEHSPTASVEVNKRSTHDDDTANQSQSPEQSPESSNSQLAKL